MAIVDPGQLKAVHESDARLSPLKIVQIAIELGQGRTVELHLPDCVRTYHPDGRIDTAPAMKDRLCRGIHPTLVSFDEIPGP